MAKQSYIIDMNLINRIKDVMEKENVRANTFAEELGYNQGSMSLTLNGKRPVPMSLVDAISSTYNVNKDWLLSGKGTMYKEEEKHEEKDAASSLIELAASLIKEVEALRQELKESINEVHRLQDALEKQLDCESYSEKSKHVLIAAEPQTNIA